MIKQFTLMTMITAIAVAVLIVIMKTATADAAPEVDWCDHEAVQNVAPLACAGY